MDYNNHDKYKRPDWLAGKLYTVVSEQEDLTKFAECLRILGLDTIINASGCYTIFAPTDEAMDQFLAENQYTGISDIPKDELERITEFHMIQNPWTLEQLQELNINGWIDPEDPWSRPNAYKRQTLLKNPNEKYWIKYRNKREFIVMDSMAASNYRTVFVRSRKYVPVFYDEFFDINNLSPEDYSFYFDRQYEPGNVYYAEAKIIRSDIIAENGFVHVVDRVVNPMLNAKELLERELPGETYKIFQELVYQYYPFFEPNMSATFNQPVFRYGGAYDTLYDLSYPDLAFNLHEELTGDINTETKYTLVYHNGMYVPTDDAFQVFLDEILTAKSGYPHWASLKYVPEDIIHIIVDRHFFNHPLYSTTINNGISGGDGNIVYLNEEDFIRKEFGSNCTFLGMNKYTPSRLFTSVTGPVFLRPVFSSFRYAMEYSGTGNRVARERVEYSFFPIPNGELENELSLLMEWTDINANQYRFYAISQFSGFKVYFSSWDISRKILNQVGTSLPNGSAQKEFIRTLGGNYIIWDNSDNTVRGSEPTTFGYEGDLIIDCHPILLGEPADNGKVWQVNSWFDFGNTGMKKSNYGMYTALSGYPTFLGLLEQAGLLNPISNEFTFLRKGRYYTIFIPSDQALKNYQADTLSKTELTDFLLYHFVDGDLIFTDNKMPTGYYQTLYMDKRLNIRPGPDIIEILDNAGIPYVSVTEAENVSNIMVTTNSEVTAVIHKINAVLIDQ